MTHSLQYLSLPALLPSSIVSLEKVGVLCRHFIDGQLAILDTKVERYLLCVQCSHYIVVSIVETRTILLNVNQVDSGGAFLPLQAEIFPDVKHGGRSFRNQVLFLSSYFLSSCNLMCGR